MVYCGFHYTSADDGYFGSGIKIKRAIKKYGKEKFRRIILDYYSTNKEREQKEQLWIKRQNTIVPTIGYNISVGGVGGTGLKHTLETKKKISDNISGKNHPFYGKHHTLETKKKISTKLKGSVLSEETKKKISKSHTGTNNHFYGKHHNITSITLMRNNHNNTKIKINNIEYISVRDASRKLDIPRNTINNRLKSKNFKQYKYL